MVPFSLLWSLIAGYWFYAVIERAAPTPFLLVGGALVLVAVYIVFGRFFADAKQRSATFYALTRQRILIVSGVFRRNVKSIDVKTLTELSLSEGAGARGTITFGPQHPRASMIGAGWPGADHYLGPRFDSIADARGVFESIRKAQTGQL